MPRKSTRTGKFKLKTHRATAKRFKLTGTGKLMRTKIGKGHLRRHTSTRHLPTPIDGQGKSINKRIKRQVP